MVHLETGHLSNKDKAALDAAIRVLRAPLPKADRGRLQRAAKDVAATAQSRGLGLSAWELLEEQDAAEQHFELGCWLRHYATRVGRSEGLVDRIDCLRRILLSDLAGSPRSLFHTCFGFGEREFDTIFEMGDSDAVMRAVVPLRRHAGVARKFEAFGWTEAYLADRKLLPPGREPGSLLRQEQGWGFTVHLDEARRCSSAMKLDLSTEYDKRHGIETEALFSVELLTYHLVNGKPKFYDLCFSGVARNDDVDAVARAWCETGSTPVNFAPSRARLLEREREHG